MWNHCSMVAWMIYFIYLHNILFILSTKTPEGLFLNENKLATWRSIGALANYALLELKVGGWKMRETHGTQQVLLGGGGVETEESEHFRKSLHKDFKYREKELALPMILCWFVGYWTAGAKNTADRFGLPTGIAHAPETGDWGKSALDIWKFATP